MSRIYKSFVTEEAFEEFVNDFDWSESEIGNISYFDDDKLDQRWRTFLPSEAA